MYTCLELAVEFQCAAVIEVIAANPTPGSGYMVQSWLRHDLQTTFAEHY